ncbi:MAG: hypothetical protein Q8N69_03215 [bacterium]|nr:hypothetical protein [bacterium]
MRPAFKLENGVVAILVDEEIENALALVRIVRVFTDTCEVIDDHETRITYSNKRLIPFLHDPDHILSLELDDWFSGHQGMVDLWTVLSIARLQRKVQEAGRDASIARSRSPMRY